jgi:hypothetical protein
MQIATRLTCCSTPPSAPPHGNAAPETLGVVQIAGGQSIRNATAAASGIATIAAATKPAGRVILSSATIPRSVENRSLISTACKGDFADRAYSISGPRVVIATEIIAGRDWRSVTSADGVICKVATTKRGLAGDGAAS